MNLRGELKIKYTLYNQFASEKRLPAEAKEHLLGCGGSERVVIIQIRTLATRYILRRDLHVIPLV
jgi:hypothetical protein